MVQHLVNTSENFTIYPYLAVRQTALEHRLKSETKFHNNMQQIHTLCHSLLD
jgi:hypothetical protein